jgi:hypothetical protein
MSSATVKVKQDFKIALLIFTGGFPDRKSLNCLLDPAIMAQDGKRSVAE